MITLAALLAAEALVVGSPEAGFATVELTGPPGAVLVVDGKPQTVFDGDGRLVVRLSAVRHMIAVEQDGHVLSRQEVTFGAGARIRLDLGPR